MELQDEQWPVAIPLARGYTYGHMFSREAIVEDPAGTRLEVLLAEDGTMTWRMIVVATGEVLRP